jgi:hypothetical protein
MKATVKVKDMLIFNEMMNMRGDEGDSESERYTS